MQPLALTLKGFRGVRDGLRRDTLTLDFEALARDAALVATPAATAGARPPSWTTCTRT
jgi:exonuclease SbcC